VDTLGFLLGVVISAANVHDKRGLIRLMQTRNSLWSQLHTLFADSAYRGPELREECKQQGLELKVVERLQGWDLESSQMKTISEFRVTPKRWIVERTFAWLGRFRRFCKDYEFFPRLGAWLLIFAMMRLILNRITGG